MKYKEYLKSDSWKKMRKRVIGYGGKQCWICGKRKKLHTHHKTYKRLFKEDFKKDLYMLCPHHHSEVHRISKERNVSIWEATECLKKEKGTKWTKRDTADYLTESRRLQKIGL